MFGFMYLCILFFDFVSQIFKQLLNFLKTTKIIFILLFSGTILIELGRGGHFLSWNHCNISIFNQEKNQQFSYFPQYEILEFMTTMSNLEFYFLIYSRCVHKISMF